MLGITLVGYMTLDCPQTEQGGQNQKSHELTLNIVPLKTRFVSIHSDDSVTVGSHRVDESLQEDL